MMSWVNRYIADRTPVGHEPQYEKPCFVGFCFCGSDPDLWWQFDLQLWAEILQREVVEKIFVLIVPVCSASWFFTGRLLTQTQLACWRTRVTKRVVWGLRPGPHHQWVIGVVHMCTCDHRRAVLLWDVCLQQPWVFVCLLLFMLCHCDSSCHYNIAQIFWGAGKLSDFSTSSTPPPPPSSSSGSSRFLCSSAQREETLLEATCCVNTRSGLGRCFTKPVRLREFTHIGLLFWLRSSGTSCWSVYIVIFTQSVDIFGFKLSDDLITSVQAL